MSGHESSYDAVADFGALYDASTAPEIVVVVSR